MPVVRQPWAAKIRCIARLLDRVASTYSVEPDRASRAAWRDVVPLVPAVVRESQALVREVKTWVVSDTPHTLLTGLAYRARTRKGLIDCSQILSHVVY